MTGPLRLGLNTDHVATVRNARGGARPPTSSPRLFSLEASSHLFTSSGLRTYLIFSPFIA